VPMVNLPNNKKGRPQATLDIPSRDSLWYLTIEKEREGIPDAAEGHLLPRRSARAATALEALLLFSCPIIWRVCGPAHPPPKRITRVLSVCFPPPGPLAADRPRASHAAIADRLLRLPHRHDGEMRTGNGLPFILRYGSTITTTCLAQPWLSSEARRPVSST
jgi:hypothetical protein